MAGWIVFISPLRDLMTDFVAYRWNESGLKLTSRESSRRVKEVCDSDEASRLCLERLDLWPFHHLRGLHDGSFPRLSPLDQLEFITLRIASLPVPDPFFRLSRTRVRLFLFIAEFAPSWVL